MTQMGLPDLSNHYARLDAKRDTLNEIDAIVPWEEFRPTLERVLRTCTCGTGIAAERRLEA